MSRLPASAHPLLPAIESLCRGDHGEPFGLLGPHADGDATTIRAFLPGADAASVIADGPSAAPTAMTQLHPAGFFEARLPKKWPFAYRLRVEAGGHADERDDPYRFPSHIGEVDAHLIGEGTHQRLYDILGAHPTSLDGVAGVAFAVWAPNARRVSVVGEFNGWDGRRHPMRRLSDGGIWDLFVPSVEPGARYKYELLGPYGGLLPLKADPFAFASQMRPETASVVHRGNARDWQDGDWMARRGAAFSREAPVSIYEVHLGSWMRVPDEGHRYLTYREMAQRLVPYVVEMGFTHVQFLPISEHPFDGSWGYQPIGMYAPTSRFGSPEDFAALVEAFHEAGIGVLIDWVPGHFPTDAHGLGRFDGTSLYEHADPRQGFHRDWNTLIFNYGRREVVNYLLANALYWQRDFHIDGLRVDAVASMLYLDYSRNADDWVPNRFGGNENLEAIEFLKRMNELVYGADDGSVTVAEESTAWPGVSKPTWAGGLGFGFKWNMGWMHDTLRYMGEDPIHRRWHHNDMTFGLLYAFSENFVLPLSHDEVVHGKGSLFGRMPGDRWQKFANLRAYFGFMFAHPGKKLLFMGGEFGQEREWNHDASLDWHLLDQPDHKGLQRLVRDLNLTYRAHPALHALDCEGEGFEWIDDRDAENSVLIFMRKSGGDAPPMFAACNFTPVPRPVWRIGVPGPGRYAQVINTDDAAYGGSGLWNMAPVEAEAVPWHGRSHSVCLSLPPLATVWFSPLEG